MNNLMTRFPAMLASLSLFLIAGCAPDPADEAASEQTEQAAAIEPAPPSRAPETEPVASTPDAPEVVVLASEDLFAWLEEENWWGENMHGEQLDVPHLMIAAIKPSWQVNAQKLPVFWAYPWQRQK